jgi:hypothetical protein
VLVGHPSYSTIPKHVRSPNRSPDRRSWCPSSSIKPIYHTAICHGYYGVEHKHIVSL